MSEVTTPAAAADEPQPTREELELAARDAIHRFLGNPSGQAEDMARGFSDGELHAIVAAAAACGPVTDRAAAIVAIKDTLTASYERKRKEHEAAAVADQKALSTRAAAVRVLIAHGCPDRDARDIVGRLSDVEQAAIAPFDGSTDAIDLVEAVIRRAQSRAEADVVSVQETGGASITVGLADGTLVPDWNEGDQTAYDTAPAPVEPVAEVSAEATPAVDAPAVAADPEPTPAAEAPKPAAAAKKTK